MKIKQVYVLLDEPTHSMWYSIAIQSSILYCVYKSLFFSFSSNVHDIESNCILMTQLTKNALVKHNVENTFWQIIIMQPSYNVPCVLQGFNLQASKSCAQ